MIKTDDKEVLKFWYRFCFWKLASMIKLSKKCQVNQNYLKSCKLRINFDHKGAIQLIWHWTVLEIVGEDKLTIINETQVWKCGITAFNEKYKLLFGVNTETLIIMRANTGENLDGFNKY